MKKFLANDHLPDFLKVPFKIGMFQLGLLYMNILVMFIQLAAFGQIKVFTIAITICIGLCSFAILAYVRYKNQMYFWDILKD